MAYLLSLLVAVATLQVAVIAAEDGTACGKVKYVESAPLTGDRRWYYCKSSGDTSDNGCFIDVHPDGTGILIHKRTSYNSDKQKIEVVTFNITEANNNKPPGKNAGNADVGVTSDGNCKLSMRCGKNSTPEGIRYQAFFLFVCRTKDGCKGNTHQAFLDDVIGTIKPLEGMEGLRTEMKNYYNETLCKD